MVVFLSYSSKDKVYANRLDGELMKAGVNIFKDERELRMLADITEFMSSISKMNHAIMLISENYLRSKPCVFEFTEFLKRQKAADAIIPMLLTNLSFSNNTRNEIVEYIRSQDLPKNQRTNAGWLGNIFSRSKSDYHAAGDWENRFMATWKFLETTKCFDYTQSEQQKFSDLLSFLKVVDKDIRAEITKISLIKNEEEQDIEFDQLQNRRPGSTWVLRHRGTLCSERRQFKKAIYYFEQHMSKFPDPIDKVMDYYDIGVCYTELKFYDLAIAAHKTALSISPKAYLSLRGLGDAYFMSNDFDNAFKYYELSNNFDRSDRVLVNLATIEDSRGNMSKAISLLKEAISLNGNNSMAYLNLAATYKRHGELISYGQMLESAWKKFPDNSQVLTQYAVHNQENISPQQMVEILRKSLSLSAQHIETRLYLGYALFRKSPLTTEKSELLEARDLLIATLKMNLTDLQKQFLTTLLKLIVQTLGERHSLDLLEGEYPSKNDISPLELFGEPDNTYPKSIDSLVKQKLSGIITSVLESKANQK